MQSTEPPAADAAENRETDLPAGLRVLVAEDHPFLRRVASALLQRAGHQVIEVDDGRAAVAAAARADVDVILMDVEMPGMDGLTATRLIRTAERVRGGHLPIIALTAHPACDERERSLAAGLDGHVEKPLDVARLLEEIAAVMARHTAGRFPCRCAAPVAEGEPPPFDRAAVLDRVCGDEALLGELIEVLAQDIPVRLAAIDAAVAAGDSQALEGTAHALCGALLAFSAAPAADAARALERGAGDPPEAEALAAALRRELERLQAALGAWRSS